MPRISVVLPVYNAEKYIRECIDSVLNQTFTDIELLVIDDGSFDATPSIVQSVSDPRLRYFRSERNAGTASAARFGYGVASGEFIANIDADDVALPDRLDLQYAFMKNFPDITVVGGVLELFGDETGFAAAPAVDSQIKMQLLPGTANIYNPTALIRKAFLDEHAIACEPELKGAFDWGFWVKIMLHGGKFANLERPLLKYRSHPEQQSRNAEIMRSEFAQVRCRVLEIFYPDLSAAERVLVEPLLQWLDPPPISVHQLIGGVEILDKILRFKEVSFAGEDRGMLRRYVTKCKAEYDDVLEQVRSGTIVAAS
ncbi:MULTISPECIES: glycosyltransferase family 2 protein [Mesorhizobium]|uniref:glycosyltransferase family 2 protein n=1 Tax=Mesorhizobium TaxID=68287 RepID=UPI001314FCCF|nr:MULTISPECIES: glycosyltransferase family 2 protein [Mesorhizobium]